MPRLFIFISLLFLESAALRAKNYGTYCGQLREQEHGTRYNVKGVVWAPNRSSFLVKGFAFQPDFILSENVTFWAGPGVPTRARMDDIFPSPNGFYLKPLKISAAGRHFVDKPKFIVAKRPSSADIAAINLGARAEGSQSAAAPEPIPARRRRQVAATFAAQAPASAYRVPDRSGRLEARPVATKTIYGSLQPSAYASSSDYVRSGGSRSPVRRPTYGGYEGRPRLAGSGSLQPVRGLSPAAETAGARLYNARRGSFETPTAGMDLSGLEAARRLSLLPSVADLTQYAQYLGVPGAGQPSTQLAAAPVVQPVVTQFSRSTAPQQIQKPSAAAPAGLNSAQLYNYYANKFGGGLQSTEQKLTPDPFLGAFGNTGQQNLATDTTSALFQSLQQYWLPKFLDKAAASVGENLQNTQPLHVSLINLKGIEKYFWGDGTEASANGTTKKIQLGPTTSQNLDPKTTVAAATTSTSTTAAAPSRKDSKPVVAEKRDPAAQPETINLIVQGGRIEVPASSLDDPNNPFRTPAASTSRISFQSGGNALFTETPFKTTYPSTTATTAATTTTTPKPRYPPLVWQWSEDVILNLPLGRTMEDVRWLSLWDHDKKQSIATMLMPRGDDVQFPKPYILGAQFNSPGGPLTKEVRSGRIEIMDAKTIRIHDFYYEGDAPGAWFKAGPGVIPTPAAGSILPILRDDGTYDCDYLKPMNGETLTLKMPGSLEVTDVFWLSVFCEPYGISFAHIHLPFDDLTVPQTNDPFPEPECLLENV